MNLKQLGSIAYFAFAFLLVVFALGLTVWTMPTWTRWIFWHFPHFLIVGLLVKFTPLKQPFRYVFNKAYYFIIYQNKIFWESLYDVMLMLYPTTVWTNVNYGFAALTEEGKTIALEDEDESERFSLQLFHWAVTGMGTIKKFENLTVVEISSGRGGGVSYVARYLKPAKTIGIDISTAQIEWCRKEYAPLPNLEFYHGDAEKLSELPVLNENKADIVLSVDSAHLYPNFKKFCEEVYKILKPGGYFCITDFREAQYVEKSEREMESTSLKIVKKQNITANQLHAMLLDGERRMKIIEEHVHFWFKPFLRYNSGASGSRIYKGFDSGKFVSMTYVLQKPKNASS